MTIDMKNAKCLRCGLLVSRHEPPINPIYAASHGIDTFTCEINFIRLQNRIVEAALAFVEDPGNKQLQWKLSKLTKTLKGFIQ